jgi:hypothetical protein
MFIKKFESFTGNLLFDVDDIYYSKAVPSLHIDSDFSSDWVDDPKVIESLLNEYRGIYLEHKQKFNGVYIMSEFLKKNYSHFFSEMPLRSMMGKIELVIRLEIFVSGFGSFTIDFSIYDKSIKSSDFSKLGKKIECDRCEGRGFLQAGFAMIRTCPSCTNGFRDDSDYKSEKDIIINFIQENIMRRRLSYDSVIDELQLEFLNNFNWKPIRTI